jgi:hypothetical protein
VPRNGLDPLFPQRLPQRRDLEREIRLFDKCVRPQSRHQFLFRQSLASTPYQQQQQLVGLRRERHPLAVAGQEALIPIQPVRTEFVRDAHRFNPASQFTITVIGACGSSPTWVLIKNRWPSGLAS